MRLFGLKKTLPAFLAFTLGILTSGLSVPFAAQAQSAKAVARSARLTGAIDYGQTVRLPHHTPEYAASDRVPSVALDPAARLDGLVLLLSRAPQVEAAFTQLLADQLDPASPRFHQWLTPQQAGELYGAAQPDIDAVTSWLRSAGLTVTDVSLSRTAITFGGSAQTVAQAFGVNFRTFALANGESRFSTTEDPAVPAAIASVIRTIAGLSQVIHHPTAHRGELVQPTTDSLGRPQYTSSSSGRHYLLDSDFNKAFSVNTAGSAGFNGTGQRIAIVGLSRVDATDIAQVQTLSGLTARQATVVIPTTGADPGIVGDTSGTDSGAQDEATLDVNRTLGTALGASDDLVVSRDIGAGNTTGTSGLFIAINYAVNTVNDPILSISFGGCEALNGQSIVLYEDSIAQQAASQGITTFVSSGDSSAASCNAFAASGYESPQRLNINDLCASSYVTCMGGSEFADFATPATYWSATNSPTDSSSILGYIPEGAWNDVTAPSGTVLTYRYGGSGGGVSTFIAKPTWQTGVGVLPGSFRLVPDLAYPSSTHDGYVTCLNYLGANCGGFYSFGGTSAAAPTMAAVQAIANGRLGGRQGNMNPTWYKLAATPTNNVYHDITVASSGVTGCAVTTPSMCNNSTPTATSLTGGLSGYLVTAGWDAVTGWGTIDVNNLVTALGVTPLATTTTKLTAAPMTISTTQTVVFSVAVTSTTAGTPSGTVTFTSNNGTATTTLGPPVTLANAAASSAALAFTTAGTYTITATYSGDTTFAPSSATFSLVVTTPVLPPTTTTLVGTASNITTQQTVGYTATVTNTAAGTPTGSVLFMRTVGTGTPVNLGTAVPLSGGKATLAPVAVPAGTYTITAIYSGDANFNGSTSAGVPLTVTSIPSVTTVGPASQSVAYAAPVTVTATVAAATGNTGTPTGTVQFSVDGINQGMPVALTGSSATSPALSITSGTHIVKATYVGDFIFASSTSATGATVIVAPAPSFTITPNPATLTITAGASGSSTLTYTGANGFAGTIVQSCAVNFNGGTTVTNAPTCSYSAPSVTIAAGGTTATGTITISTVAAHNVHSGGNAENHTPSLRTLGGMAIFSVLLLLLPTRRRALRAFRGLAAALLLACGFFALSGCGNGGTPPNPVIPGTSTGSYDVTINGNTNLGQPGNIGYSGTIKLTVQ